MKDVTCAVYDYYVSIYTKGYSFNDADPRVDIFLTDEPAEGDPKPIVQFFPPDNENSTASYLLMWWAARITVNGTGDVCFLCQIQSLTLNSG
jgi:hypothetical protein